ncbi:GtrA family protein [Longispora sp. K20-0274]|uniref:GtrA family protein n=1 Tax=Longispora sp. K20-0274 TaxID=3088255 RepID=UPI00399C0D7A
MDLTTLYLLHGVAGLPLPLATALAFSTAFLANFLVNRFWSFSARGAIAGHFLRYGILVLANLTLTVVLVQALTRLGLDYRVAKAACTATLFVANYFATRLWIYRPGPAEVEAES